MSPQTTHNAPRFQRSPRLVWRLAEDRVLVRRVDQNEPIAEDLFGAAALVWVAADEPLRRIQLASEAGLSEESVQLALDLLLEHRWIEQVE